jgi:hypothetical protein
MRDNGKHKRYEISRGRDLKNASKIKKQEIK